VKATQTMCSMFMVGLVLLVGCGDDDVVAPVDLGVADLGVADLGASDLGPMDAGRRCAQNDAGDPVVDLGLVGDLGPVTEIPDSGPEPDGSTPGMPFGCLPLRACLADEGDPSELTYETFAAPLFETYCTRCHSVDNVGPTARNGAPDSINLDVRASVYANLPRIRQAAGVLNFMPFTPPRLPCERRAQLVTWIDTGAP